MRGLRRQPAPHHPFQALQEPRGGQLLWLLRGWFGDRVLDQLNVVVKTDSAV